MITFEEEFDLNEIYELLTKEDENTFPPSDLGLKCIGYQTNLILFACNAVVNENKVTKLGYFCMQTKQITTLYVHPAIIDVLVGSLNMERNLLVYARRKHPKSSTYQSYLVELINMKTFDLNIESPHTQHLLFFPWRNAKEKGNRREHLVFFLEKRHLGIVHVTTTLNQDNKIEVQQIQKEYLVQHYVWYQLDLSSMRLYYIYLQQRVSDGEVRTSTSMFNVFQFSSRSNPVTVISVSLPLPIYPELYSASKRYMVAPASSCMPDSTVNIIVLRPTSDIESLVLCVAYHAQYFIYLVHSGYLVECKHGDIKDKSQSIMFVNISGYVIVYSPPNILHCVDASSDHLIRNNMVFEDIPIPPALDIDTKDFTQSPSREMPLCPITLSSEHSGVMVNQSTIYKIVIKSRDLLTRYKAMPCPVAWSFLIHFAIAHLKDMNLAHKMLLHSMTIYPSTDISELLKEFLLTGSHMSLSEQEGITSEILSAMPYANEETQVAVLDRNRVMKISNVYQSITKPMLTSQKIQNVVTQAGPFIRFNLEDFVSRCGHMIWVPAATNSTSSGLSSSNHPSSNHLHPSSNHPSSSANSISSSEDTSPAYSHNDSEDEESSLFDTLYNALEYHIRRRFNESIPLSQCQDAVKSYFGSLAKHCREALAIALIAAGKTPGWYPDSDCLLDSQSEPGLGALLKLLDVLKYVMIQLGCPLPATFEWLHVYSGYTTLSTELFLRRISNKSIRVSPSTVRKFLTTLSKDPESQMFCSALVSSLSRPKALEALKAWDSTTYRRFTAQNYLVALRNKAGLRSPAEPVNETPPYLRKHPFIPVNSFFSYLYHKLQNPDMSRKLEALSEISMEETRLNESDETLRGIAFY